MNAIQKLENLEHRAALAQPDADELLPMQVIVTKMLNFQRGVLPGTAREKRMYAAWLAAKEFILSWEQGQRTVDHYKERNRNPFSFSG